VEEAGRALLAHFGCSAVVITRGEKGMSVFEESSPRHLQVPATSFEVTYARVASRESSAGNGSAGLRCHRGRDTVLSVLALAVAAGAPLADAAMLANTAAGVVVGKLGTASVSRRSFFTRSTTSAGSRSGLLFAEMLGPGTGKLNDLSTFKTQTSTTLVLRLFSVSEMSGMGE